MPSNDAVRLCWHQWHQWRLGRKQTPTSNTAVVAQQVGSLGTTSSLTPTTENCGLAIAMAVQAAAVRATRKNGRCGRAAAMPRLISANMVQVLRPTASLRLEVSNRHAGIALAASSGGGGDAFAIGHYRKICGLGSTVQPRMWHGDDDSDRSTLRSGTAYAILVNAYERICTLLATVGSVGSRRCCCACRCSQPRFCIGRFRGRRFRTCSGARSVKRRPIDRSLITGLYNFSPYRYRDFTEFPYAVRRNRHPPPRGTQNLTFPATLTNEFTTTAFAYATSGHRRNHVPLLLTQAPRRRWR